MSVGFSLELFDLTTFTKEILPAREAYVETGDSGKLVVQLEKVLALARDRDLPQESLKYADLLVKECEDYIAILTDQKPVPEQFVRPSAHETRKLFCDGWVMANLTEHLCEMAEGEKYGLQDMSGWLGEYLISRSTWIDKTMDSDQLDGGKLDLGEPADYFSKDQLRRFEQELLRVPRPEQKKLAEQYDRLLDLVRKAISSDRLVLLRLWG